jgi:RNA polymerase sigma factor (sigma-70 family)
MESNLVERAQRGDRDAFAALLASHQAGAKRLAMSLGLNPDDAADAVQEASMRAYRAIQRFRVGEPFRPWYAQIVANEVRGLHRRAGRRSRLADRLESLPQPTQDGPEVDALRGEQAMQLAQALEVLCELHRLPILYRYFAGLSEAETAAVLHIPPGTVKSRVSRGLSRLRLVLLEPAGGSRPSEAA